MMKIKANNAIDQSLLARQRKIETAKEYLASTKTLFDEFGSIELKTSHARFAELENALSSDQVRLVVLGEFSRGKSRLLNALLDIKLLPTALQTTTAVNTFLRALPPDRKERFIRIHSQDRTRPPQDLPWNEDDVLKRWGTELDQSNADARMEVDYIEVFFDHPLLQKGLVLIDTPGLETIVKHHEQITRKAIAESHIALWVQSTDALGGNKSEWNFMRETLRRNFQKFITVINKWDHVLAPQDFDGEQLNEADRVAKNLQVVKANFAHSLAGEDSDKLAKLTDASHLMGVSAQWAEDPDPEKRRRSGIDQLAERIGAMVSSGEAMDQILLKPLQQLSSVQKQLADRIKDELQQLESTDSLEKRKYELQQLELDIKILEDDVMGETDDSRNEHERASKAISEKVLGDLIKPLAMLKNSIGESSVIESHIKKMIAKKAKKIGLPEDLQEQFQLVSGQVDQAWQAQKREMPAVLNGLRGSYLKKMEKHVRQIEAGVGKLNIDPLSLDVSFDLDFSEIEKYHDKEVQLKDEMDRAQDKIHELETAIANTSFDERKRQQALAELDRCARQLDNMGPPPAPVTSRKRQKTGSFGSGFLWLSSTYEEVDVTDYSGVKAYERDRNEMRENVLSKEDAIKKIIEDEEALTGVRRNFDAAKRKAENEYAKMERAASQAAIRAGRERDDLIAASVRRLSRETTLKLEETIKFLNNYVTHTVPTVFLDQATLLENCIREELMEPVNAKRDQLQEVQDLLHQGAAEIATRKARLYDAQQQIVTLQAQTQLILTA